MTGVGRALTSRNLTLHFVGPYQISEKMGEVAYQITLPPSLVNLHDVFHVSQLRRYILDPSYVIKMNDVQVRDNLTVEAAPVQIKGWELKQFWGNNITLVEVL